MLVGPKYKSTWKILASAHFTSSFDLDSKTEAFIKKYKLQDDIVVEEPKKKGDNKTAKLKPEVAEKLLRTSTLFIHDNKYIEEREATVINGVTEDIKEKFASMHKGVPDELAVTVMIETSDVSDQEFQDVVVELQLGQTEEQHTFESLNVIANFHEIVGDAAMSYNWAAWLGGEEDSPFYDDAFVEGYGRDWMSIAIEQFFHTRNETLYFDELKKMIDSLMKDYSPEFTYVVDHDERGEYRAHVEDPSGKVVYEISNDREGLIPTIEDGFMKNTRDMKGLTKYLIQLEIIPKNSDDIKYQG